MSRQLGGIIGEEGKLRRPVGEMERCKHAIFCELVRQQMKDLSVPLITVSHGCAINIGIDIDALMNAIQRELQ